MIITKEVLQGLNTNINVTWLKYFKNAPTAEIWKSIAMQVNSKNATEQYAWLGAVPAMREFVDERIPGTLSGYKYSIDNKKFESTLDVDRDLIEDDRTGQVMLAVQSLATKAGKAYTILVTNAFAAGTTTPVFDGQNFFSASHPNGSNYLGTAKDITGANLDAAELLLAGMTDDTGEPLGYQGTHLIVGPYNAAAAKNLMKMKTINVGGVPVDNPYYGRYQIVVLPHLGTTNKTWAVADLTQGIMPFVLQIRVAITLVAKTDLNSDRAFDKDIFTWGTRGRHNAGYGDHQLIVGAVAN